MTVSSSVPTRVLILGAGGRDFHNFNVAYRQNPRYRVAGFTAAQIPGIAGRRYPPSLAGPLYPDGIPIHDAADLESLVRRERVDEVVLAYSDLSHVEVMHLASRALAAGATFTMLGPDRTMLRSRLPVIAVCAVRTGAGKSPLAEHIACWLRDRGHRTGVLRHPMPYGALEQQAVQRLASAADLDAARATIEEREEYERYIRHGLPVFAGVDYARVLALAEPESQVILWDGGNNDFPFIRPDLHLVVVDPHRAGHELTYHPGETNLRMADAYVISKADSAPKGGLAAVRRNLRAVKPQAPVVVSDLQVRVDKPDLLAGKRAVVVGDGPTLTHGGMRTSAGTLAARHHRATVVDARPYAVGALRITYAAFRHILREVPAMGYSTTQVADLEATLRDVPADVVVAATPVDLERLVRLDKPIVRVEYAFRERGPVLERLLTAFADKHLAVRR